MNFKREWLDKRAELSLAIAAGIITVGVLAFAFISPAKAAPAPGDEVLVRIACKSEATVQAHAKAIAEDKNFDRSTAFLQADRAAGECAMSPMPLPVIVVQVRTPVVFVHENGSTIELAVVEIEDRDGGRYWTIAVEKLGGA